MPLQSSRDGLRGQSFSTALEALLPPHFTKENTETQRMTVGGPGETRTNDHTPGLKTTGIYPLQVWRPEAQDQDVTGPCSICRLQRGSFLPLPAAGASSIPGLVATSPHLCLCCHMTISLCVSQISPSFFYKDPGHWAHLIQIISSRDHPVRTSAETLFPQKATHNLKSQMGVNFRGTGH